MMRHERDSSKLGMCLRFRSRRHVHWQFGMRKKRQGVAPTPTLGFGRKAGLYAVVALQSPSLTEMHDC
jgi:hypothetical protein